MTIIHVFMIANPKIPRVQDIPRLMMEVQTPAASIVPRFRPSMSSCATKAATTSKIRTSRSLTHSSVRVCAIASERKTAALIAPITSVTESKSSRMAEDDHVSRPRIIFSTAGLTPEQTARIHALSEAGYNQPKFARANKTDLLTKSVVTRRGRNRFHKRMTSACAETASSYACAPMLTVKATTQYPKHNLFHRLAHCQVGPRAVKPPPLGIAL